MVSGAFLFARHRTEDAEQIFETIEWYPVPPDGYGVRNEFHFELTDEVRAHVIKRAHDLGACIVEVHSHGGPLPAAFSPSDLWGFREFVPHVWWRLKGRPYLALVATRRDFDGLAWRGWRDRKILSVWMALWLTGRCSRLRDFRLLRGAIMDTERYDRNIRFFGKEGQVRLGAASVAVVGVGGLGTHVVQQLALLGVGRLGLVDKGELKESSRNRYIGARHDDPVPGSPKVFIGERLAREINPHIEVETVHDQLASQAAFEMVKGYDCVFGCLDNDAARLFLNELCLAYGKPYFDLASDISIGGAQYGGRVCVVWRDAGCLVCYGEIDATEANLDSMTEEQRQDHEAIYGVRTEALGEAGPSVVSINGMVASLAVTEFIPVATGTKDEPRQFLKYHGHRGIVTIVADEPTPDCYFCVGVRDKGEAAGLSRYLKRPDVNGVDC